MLFTIYQIHLSDAQYKRINKLGWADAQKSNKAIAAYREVKFRGSDNWKPDHLPLYNKVALCEADSMEHVFHIMNAWTEEERVTRLDKLHSLSVGDIVETESGCYYMVDFVGFKSIEVH